MDAEHQEHASNLTVTEHHYEKSHDQREIRLYSHSDMYYWWPVWALGFILGILTWTMGETEGEMGRFLTGSGPGLIYTAVLLLVIYGTNFTIRGVAAIATILGVLLVVVILAWWGVWDDIVHLLPELRVHMNTGFYLVSSTVLFILWCLTFYILDRLSYWRIVPGQITHEKWVGGGEESYDTGGLQLRQRHFDPFKNLLIGLGAGDLELVTPNGHTFVLTNVLFVEYKVSKIQDLIKRKPD